MVSKGAAVAGVLVVAAGAAAALVLTKKTSAAGAVASLTLSASATTATVGQEITVTVVAKDASGNPVAGVTPTLMANGNAESPDFGKTDASGTSTVVVSFPAAGTYVLQAQV